LVKNRITCYQKNSFIFLFQTIIVLAKNTKRLVYELILINTKLYIFRAINKVFSKYRRAKKNRIRQGDILIIEEVYNIIAQNKINKQI
jgi:hypothetical protein